MNKKIGLVLGFALISIFLVSIVSAADPFAGVGTWLNDAGTSTVNYLGNLSPDQNQGFMKFLFFVLVFLFISVILDYIPLFEGKKFIKFVASAIISILSVLFMPATLVSSILNPYMALGATLLSIIPFVLLFIFTGKIMVKNAFFRSLVWFAFAVILLGLSILSVSKPNADAISWIYGLVSIGAAFMCLWGDRVDQKIWEGEMEAKKTAALKRIEERKLARELEAERSRSALEGK